MGILCVGALDGKNFLIRACLRVMREQNRLGLRLDPGIGGE